MVERIGCNGRCPYIKEIKSKREIYFSSRIELVSASEEAVYSPESSDRIFSRSLIKVRRVGDFLNKLPPDCRECFFEKVDKEDLNF